MIYKVPTRWEFTIVTSPTWFYSILQLFQYAMLFIFIPCQLFLVICSWQLGDRLHCEMRPAASVDMWNTCLCGCVLCGGQMRTRRTFITVRQTVTLTCCLCLMRENLTSMRLTVTGEVVDSSSTHKMTSCGYWLPLIHAVLQSKFSSWAVSCTGHAVWN